MRRALLALLLAAAAIRADEVVLKGGGRLSCEVVEETDAELTIRLPHGTMVVPRRRVATVVREGTSAYLKREGAASLRYGHNRSAVEMLERAYALDPQDEVTRAALLEALEAYTAELVKAFRLDEARAALERIEQIHPGHGGGRVLLVQLDALEREATELLDRGERALEQGAFLDAIVLLDAWRLRCPPDDPRVAPRLAAAHLGAARTAEEFGALRQALDHYRMADRYGARKEAAEPLYLLQPIAVLEALKQGDLADARRLLDGIRTTYPDRAVPIFLRAVLNHTQGHVGDAVAAYAEAKRVSERSSAPPRGLDFDLVRAHASATLRASIARPPQEGVKTWRETFLGPLESDRGARYFTVYAASRERAAEISAAAASWYDQIARELLGRVPDAPAAEIVVHPSRRSYLAADPSPPGSPLAEITVGREKTLGVCYGTLDTRGRPLVRIEIDGQAAGWEENTLPHELVHLIQRQGLKAFRKGHWLDEGLATIYESAQGQANRRALWHQLWKNRLPLPELLALKSTPPDKVSLFYVQANAFTRFLRDQGDELDWKRFLKAYGTGSFEQAVQDAYDLPFAELERRWEAKPH